MADYEIKIIDIDSLKPHEKIVECHLIRLAEEIKKDGCLKDPVIVDKNTMVILDGHHRYHALKKLGMKLCPVCLVDYGSEKIGVECWRKGETITKEEVVASGLSSELLPPKTSKHCFGDRPRCVDILLAILK